jgi:hypothetical protein
VLWSIRPTSTVAGIIRRDRFCLPNSGGGPFFAEVPHGSTYLLYSTDLGGGTAAGIALDPTGNAYVAGTAGPGFPTIRDAFQKLIAPNKEVNQTDAFVAKFALSSTEVPTLDADIDPQIQGQSVTVRRTHFLAECR